ncbi:MAG TPA: VTT domain-containing protein [Thermoanaerobaculia bacterium]|nr:VTT domain-containing protein [Thermoanaerobaculia bacterium]
MPVRTYLKLTLVAMTFFLGTFLLVAWVDLPLLNRPEPWMSHGSWATALLGFGLLASDVVLPVPASLVMVAHGALFGFFGGALLSLAGSMACAALGFGLGRRGGPWLERMVPAAERAKAERLLVEWGDLATVATRPVPILAETFSIFAGTTTLSWKRFLTLSLLGNLPPCLLYAATGATAARLDNAFLTFGLVLGVAAIVWFAGKRLRRTSSPSSPPAPEDAPERLPT